MAKRARRASMGVIMKAEMHEEPTPFLKAAKNEEDNVKHLNTKNVITLILDGVTT
ncbi:hypothetical protein CWI37_2735p0010 [Hamiltosporidium tvaerminnensis]|uniref:Uncharacterized protein n=1 Tax=Hamiltosporidium tvaerminnensis TaxID=1176355 RepID=A0A4V2JTM6_9MICR|nr:hypothetical protein CWI37_2735p0010 [Hamiltosporidium tvaerminnensis]